MTWDAPSISSRAAHRGPAVGRAWAYHTTARCPGTLSTRRNHQRPPVHELVPGDEHVCPGRLRGSSRPGRPRARQPQAVAQREEPLHQRAFPDTPRPEDHEDQRPTPHDVRRSQPDTLLWPGGKPSPLAHAPIAPQATAIGHSGARTMANGPRGSRCPRAGFSPASRAACGAAAPRGPGLGGYH